MKPKEVAALIGVIGLVWHCLSLLKDADHYEVNLARWRAAPTGRNLVRLALAEGILIDDIASF
jgi:hypothetical protein